MQLILTSILKNTSYSLNRLCDQLQWCLYHKTHKEKKFWKISWHL